jgi:hypothetical protein
MGVAHMQVFVGGLSGGMTQRNLHAAYVGAQLKHVRGEAVALRLRRANV